ncbi:dethiobiotin synthase [Tsukamurella sp. 8F]|uniref:dethiobiotin synthase n=1 Tax=unclassified Tsukamurella TaxID=2633480 RepID=UPI0023B951E7|nr:MULTISPECIES: dethiobiotin synthase [unclassified Tsukamurella]MDF0529192.1 dethiobiotin synthase [Tsukamurella sp. 8J]MDF0585377.1 dethiobiotin synthase [Tsukamurella sp. 8F]
MTIVCVTGTSTGVGKTIACAAIAAAAQAEGIDVAVVKPAQTGFGPGARFDADGARADADEVRRLSSGVRVVEGARYPDPLAPLTAARRAGLEPLSRVDAAALVRRDAKALTLVEGAGGVLVRLGADSDGTVFNLVDLARDLGAPVVVVADPALGTLNHTELTVAALRGADVRCSGIVLGRWPDQPGLAERCNREELAEVTGVPLVGAVPDGASALAPERFRADAPGWFAGGWVAGLAAGSIG